MCENKISFIICYNEEMYLKECNLHIQQLHIPEGFTIEILPISDATSMASGYNRGMTMSNAKYKVYLHQDVYILNKNFLQDTISIFEENPKVGLLGMVGTKKLPPNGCMWTTPLRTGKLRVNIINTEDCEFDIPITPARTYAPVQAIDGLLMMTQYDIPWREDLFDGWDFYDVSQSMEFARQGYRVVVPYQSNPWVLHDDDFLHLTAYHTYRKIFLQEYFPENISEIQGCQQTQISSSEELSAIKQTILSSIQEGDYPLAQKIYKGHCQTYATDETFCILSVLFHIYNEEMAQHMSPIFAHGKGQDPDWIFRHYRQIKLYLMRIYYQFPEEYQQEAIQYFAEMEVSQAAIHTIMQLIAVDEA